MFNLCRHTHLCMATTHLLSLTVVTRFLLTKWYAKNKDGL